MLYVGRAIVSKSINLNQCRERCSCWTQCSRL